MREQGGLHKVFNKNDVLEVEIIDQGTTGEGIGKIEGYALFVKDTVIGDIVRVKIMKAKKNYAFAKLIEVVKPSPYRVEPVCPKASSCGGCQLQAMNYQQQLKFKQDKVYNNLKRIGGICNFEMKSIMGMDELCLKGKEENGPFHYRNKAQFPVGTDKTGRIITGFYAGRTHRIIENRRCLLGVPENEKILDAVVDFMEKEHISAYDESTGKGLVRHVLIRYGFTTKEIMVCLVVNGHKVRKIEKLAERLAEIPGMTSITLNVNRKRTNVILGDEILSVWGRGYIEDYIGGIKYRISPLSFYQVNPVQTKKLYEKALEYAALTGNETVWDLYCGIGTISLFLAQKAKQVYGVEIVPAAIEDARNNARINGITNASFFVGKAEEVLPQMYERDGISADVIVVDPPRKGCDKSLLDTIVKMSPARVVYVSCDSATLARDLKYLCERGYEVVSGQGVDQFPMSVHVETCVLLGRK